MSRSGQGTALPATHASERRTLLQVLLLNLGLTVILVAGGLIADSTALIANGIDNGSDAVVYGISYYAVVRSIRWKAAAAALSGVLLIILSLGVIAEVVRRFTSSGRTPRVGDGCDGARGSRSQRVVSEAVGSRSPSRHEYAGRLDFQR